MKTIKITLLVLALCVAGYTTTADSREDTVTPTRSQLRKKKETKPITHPRINYRFERLV
jgi:hypothetical protein